jgi:hypothetical protein
MAAVRVVTAASLRARFRRSVFVGSSGRPKARAFRLYDGARRGAIVYGRAAAPVKLCPIARLAGPPPVRHGFGMIATVRLDASSRIVLSRDVRRAAGIAAGQKLKVSAVPGRIVLEAEPNPRGKVVRRGKLKVWTGAVPDIPLAEAVEQARRYER